MEGGWCEDGGLGGGQIGRGGADEGWGQQSRSMTQLTGEDSQVISEHSTALKGVPPAEVFRRGRGPPTISPQGRRDTTSYPPPSSPTLAESDLHPEKIATCSQPTSVTTQLASQY